MKAARLLILLAAIAVPAMAAEAGGHGAAGPEGARKGGAPGTNVDMPFLVAPVMGDDGKLTGYAYISNRLTAASVGAVLAVREKLPFIQDAFVRDVNGRAITQPGHPDQVDMPGLEARLLADAQKVTGAGKVKTITICTVQMAPLKAKAPVAGASAPPAAKSRCIN
jgi:hypothetical protein